jgi:hypothetical protein
MFFMEYPREREFETDFEKVKNILRGDMGGGAVIEEENQR